MEWAILSAGCAAFGLAMHGLSEWQNAKTRASIAELKCDLLERQNSLIAPLGSEVAAMGARMEALSDEVHFLRQAQT